MFKRCKGAAKALCAAFQITSLMAGLSGFLVSVEKERTSGGERSILFLVTAKSLTRLFIRYLLLSFLLRPASQVHLARIQMVVMTWQCESRT